MHQELVDAAPSACTPTERRLIAAIRARVDTEWASADSAELADAIAEGDDRSGAAAVAARCAARYTAAMLAMAPAERSANNGEITPEVAALLAEAVIAPLAWRLWDADGAPAPGVAEVREMMEEVRRELRM